MDGSPQKPNIFFIYVLELEHGKYYVGRTHDLLARMDEHRGLGKYPGSEWTAVHKVKKLLRVIETDNYFMEDMYTKMYMSIYGIDNVRGGSYTYGELTPEQRKFLEIEIRNAQDSCYKCGSKNHFAGKCTTDKPATTNKKGKKWTPEEVEKLKRECKSGMSVEDIAKLHGRTEGGVTSKLEKLGVTAKK